MKKIISFFLCLVFVCFSFVSCKDTIIGEDLKNRTDDTNDDETIQTLNFYIIVGKGTSEQAKDTVASNINAYLKETYEVQLNIEYCTEEEYYGKVLASVADGVKEEDRADIVLINTASLFDALYESNDLVTLTEFYNDKDYQKLNAIVEDNLLAASLVKEPASGQYGVAPEDITYVYNYYTVPNNHVIGEYTYIVIDKTQARDVLHYSSSKIAAMNDKNKLESYKNAIGQDMVACYTGDYSLKLLLEYGFTSLEEYAEYVKNTYGESYVSEYTEIIVDGEEYFFNSPLKKVNFVNVASYPNATKAEAMSSAFAIIKHLDDIRPNSVLTCTKDGCGGTVVYTKDREGDEIECPKCTKTIKSKLTEDELSVINKHYEKCMDVIYALNTDTQLRNMLQYGYVGTNYTFIKDEKNQNTNYISLKVYADNTNPISYDMSILYTGNQYIAYYCDLIGWNSSKHTSILRQNAESYSLTDKLEEELELLDIGEINFVAGETVSLASNGAVHGDVIFTWSTDAQGVEIDSNNSLKISPTSNSESIEFVLNLQLTCVDQASGESATITTSYAVVIE